MARIQTASTLEFNLSLVSQQQAQLLKENLMKSAIKSNLSVQRFAMAALLAASGAGAMAQGTPAAPTSPTESRMGKHDPAKRQAMMAQRQADLKATLKITSSQEGAWSVYTTAMQAPAGMHANHGSEQRAEMDKLTTPQRIDKMGEMRAQRMKDMNASMIKRGDATKALYAALSPEQQKVFDTQQSQHGRHGGPSGSSHQGRHG